MSGLSERTWTVIGTLSWIATVVIIGVGIGFYTKLQSDLEEARKYAAQAESQKDAFNFQTKEFQYSLEQVQDSISTASTFCPSGQSTGSYELDNVCGLLEYLANPVTAEYLRISYEASSARANSDFDASLLAAQEGIELLEANERHFRTPGEGEFEWRKMRLLEEIAYAKFRQNDSAEALETIEQALELEDESNKAVSGFVLSTHQKILCDRGSTDDLRIDYQSRLVAAETRAQRKLDDLPAEDLRTPYQQQLVVNYQQWVETRQLDLDYFKNDAELDNLCGPAGA